MQGARTFASILLLGLFGGPAFGASGPAVPRPWASTSTRAVQDASASGNRADYVIEARLDGDTREPKTLAGALELTWTNGSGEEVRDLWFHLYLNAFSNNRSTHLQEAGGKLRGVEIEDGWGWQNVTAVRVARAGDDAYEDVFPTFRYQQPDDENKDDRTVFSVDLPFPVANGETLRVQVDWESRLPRVRRRTGYKDDFLLVAQWFPKLGVYEAGKGWNCHQFHANTEFFSDYRTYDVTLNLPQRFKGKVMGSGFIEGDGIEAGRNVVRFLAPSSKDRLRTDAVGRRPLVHDFTWTADPDYIVDGGIFRFDDWAERYADEVARVQEALGPDVDVRLRDVDVTVLGQPEHEVQIARHREATEAALFFYGLWFGEYPYQHVTVVDPAWGARAAGGMEYPTLFTCGTRLFTTSDMLQPEGVTVHEAGHQFWYGLVGNNEHEAAWLDEGFNSFTDSEVLWRAYGARRATTTFAGRPLDGVPLVGLPPMGTAEDALFSNALPTPWLRDEASERDRGLLDWYREQPSLTYARQWTDPRWEDRSGYLRHPDADPIDTFAWQYVDRDSYVTNSYRRPAVALRTLAGVVGFGPFLRGMRHYASVYRYRHPYPDDFFASFQEGAGVDVQWYFDEVFRGTGTIDWKVEVSQERRATTRGFFQSQGGAFLELESKEESNGDAPEQPWQVEVTLRKSGTLAIPLPVRLRFADGSVENVVWTREEQLAENWKRLTFEGEAKLVSVLLDPERQLFLDEDMSDNQWFEEEDEVAAWRWGERALSLYERYFHWIAGLGG